ncbi:SDR family oxidoreductase [Rhizobiaceae bacterium n13]|uniref:SDR family oxidoreductase n=1 Tax=Ferirhizobium litorale TaxID=2927786 RepID=A0AAE3QBU0_9HYPH|nr:SDR family oxidoreductase [Fererhizobium litorale]MDI7860343.1 SDR family oxidoreductase [Fererhizobium litorale]MDI7920478.1 SDR family oxidoreductase [Fererhizobium litorale]
MLGSTSKPLAGRVVLLTNANHGVGLATANLLASAGADLALTVDEEVLDASFLNDLRRLGGRVEMYRWPSSASAVDCSRLTRSVASSLGRIDVLITNARHRAHWQVDDVDVDEEALERQYATTVRAVMLLVRSSVRFMESGARIIALSASLADRVGAPGLADYAASKAAITAFFRGAAHDLGPRGINVNVIQLGAIRTELPGTSRDDLNAEMQSNVLKRLGTPEEVANAILFLAGPSSSFITGSVLNVDGGYNA